MSDLANEPIYSATDVAELRQRAEKAEAERDELREELTGAQTALQCSYEDGAAVIARAETAEARVKALSEALEPFANVGAAIVRRGSDWPDKRPLFSYEDCKLTYGDFRRAALEGKE